MPCRLRKNDLVQVICGEHKGSTGKIIRINNDKKTALVEGLNMVKRHTKPSQKFQQGGIREIEAGIHLSNLMLMCPKTNKATRVGIKTLESGKRVRFSKKAKELID